jgi:SNF2 family DNA or RNA helicase
MDEAPPKSLYDNNGRQYNHKTKRWNKPCPDGKMRDIHTFKCVTNPNAKCKEGQERHPLTRRCVKLCKDGYTRNAEGKCVSNKSRDENGKIKKKTRVKKPQGPDDCPPDKPHWNEKTRRCNRKPLILKKDCGPNEIRDKKTGRCISLIKHQMNMEDENDEKEDFTYVIHAPTKKNLDCVKRSKLKLREYQENICKFMDTNRGIIVVHGVGTGKTLTSVTVSQCYLDKNPKGKVIVSTPKSLLENFRKELKTYGADVDDPRYLFYTHDGLCNLLKNGTVPLSFFKDALLVIDEVHNFRTRPIKKLKKGGEGIHYTNAFYAVMAAHNSKNVLGLTATPIVNGLRDLANPISMITGKKINRFPTIPSKEAFEKYQSLFSVYFRPPNDPDYPDKLMSVTPVYMTRKQYDDYENIEAMFMRRNRKYADAFHISHRIAVNNFDFMKNSPKIKWTIDLINNGKKTLIYSSFRESGSEYIGNHLDDLKIKYAVINGSKSITERKQIVEDYNSGKLRVLIITAAGGEGLDLKETRQVVLYEPVWNDANQVQIIGRAIRKGSHKNLKPEDRNVKIYKLLLTGPNGEETIDHYIARLIVNKEELTNEAIDIIKDLSIDIKHSFN